MGFGGVEFFAEFGDDSVVDGVGLAVEFDAQFSGADIGTEVDRGFHEAADEAAGVVRALQGFAGEVDQRGLAAVGDEFDGVDEVFASAAQLADALFGREVFDLDVMKGGFALGFEVVELGFLLADGGEGFAFLEFVAGGGGGGVLGGFEDAGGEVGALAGEFSVEAADLAVEGAPGGIDEPGGLGKGLVPCSTRRSSP